MLTILFLIVIVVSGYKSEKEEYKVESEIAPIQENTKENSIIEETKLEEVKTAKKEALKEGVNITGKWKGKYKIKEPLLCVAFSSSWTANLTQSGFIFSGKYESLKDGTMKGEFSDNSFIGELSGGVSATIKGEVIGNTISGTFVGPKCPGTSKKATGTFTGTKIDN